MAQGKFPVCLSFTLKEEGGESNDRRDPGGRTNRGVTQARYDHYRKKKRVQRRSVSFISEPELVEIYRGGYWDPICAESLRPGEDLSAFDYAVNSGPARARAAVVKANAGTPTLAKVIDNIATARLSFLYSLATWQAFGKGWGARVARIEAASLKMANLPIAPNVASARGRWKANAVVARGGVAAGPAGAAGTHELISDHWWAAAIILAVVLALVAIAAFNAWRQGQRVRALERAASDLAAHSAATEASKQAAAGLAQAEAAPSSRSRG